ncbi:MAG TPA: HAMP domain-containing sensor histidine kinase, partial [Myxococcota bacterium]
MRLMTRLLLSHVLPLSLLIIALASVLTLLVRMTSTLTELSDHELGALDREGALHRACWGVDVSIRRAHAACLNGSGDDDDAAERVRTHQLPLRQFLSDADHTGVSPVILDIARRYLILADDTGPVVTCASLARDDIQRRRSQIDEELTDAWVLRLKELHGAVQRKEETVAKLGATGLWLGTVLALLALLAALVIVRRLVDGIRRPLSSLERLARRIAEGEFGDEVTAEGPWELQQLAHALENMRRRLGEVDALKQGFLASVSHELRTPLSKIREALALLADGAVGPLTDKQQRVVALGRTACEREIRLVTTLLDLSRLRAGTPLRPQAGTDFGRVVAAAVDDERDDAKVRGVEIDVEECEKSEAAVGVVDPVLLERAIANLVRNAVAVSRSGQVVRVRRGLLRVDGVGTRVVIDVVDEGPGVPAVIRSVVFDPFVTAAVEHSPKSVGVGLGLALAREIARAHGGDLELVDNSSDVVGDDGTTTTVVRGSIFRLTLPLSTTRATSTSTTTMPAAPTAPPPASPATSIPTPPVTPPAPPTTTA